MTTSWRARISLIAILSLVAVCVSVAADCTARRAGASPALEPTASAAAAPDPTAAAEPAVDVQAIVDAAQSVASTTGLTRVSVTVLDRETAAIYSAGDGSALYASASLIKIAIALELFATGQMADTDVADRALDMIMYSDDDAATYLLGLVGSDVLTRVAARLGVDGVAGPTQAAYWGTNQISADAAVQLVAAGLADAQAGVWLREAMAATSCVAADGWAQCFGVRSVDASAAVKQGWMCCLDGVARLHSVGLLDDNRYVVAILTEGPTRFYSDAGLAAVSAIAAPLAALIPVSAAGSV